MTVPISTSAILRARPPKVPVDPWRPYAFLSETERGPDGTIGRVSTIFLTNRECPWRCLMCDLWRHTLDETVPAGAIPAQIDFALERLPSAATVKLYNSGSFFDAKAIPPGDHGAIAARLQAFERVIVENHPALCAEPVLAFRDRLPGTLEVAMGLETAHPEILPRLNKQMTVDDFRRAAGFLKREGIGLRAFILLRTPWMSEAEGVEWAVRSVHVAAECGATCAVVIPTRAGNGIMDRLAEAGCFHPPRLASLEAVLDKTIGVFPMRVFADLWDLEAFSTCPACFARRKDRLAAMNLQQVVLPKVECGCGG